MLAVGPPRRRKDDTAQPRAHRGPRRGHTRDYRWRLACEFLERPPWERPKEFLVHFVEWWGRGRFSGQQQCPRSTISRSRASPSKHCAEHAQARSTTSESTANSSRTNSVTHSTSAKTCTPKPGSRDSKKPSRNSTNHSTLIACWLFLAPVLSAVQIPLQADVRSETSAVERPFLIRERPPELFGGLLAFIVSLGFMHPIAPPQQGSPSRRNCSGAPRQRKIREKSTE